MLKRTIVSAAIASAMLTSTAFAEKGPAYDTWLGGFAQYYDVDRDKPEPNGYMDEGDGFGVELGFRFDSHWAARFEVADMTIDPDHNNPFGIEEEGTSLGADVLYFLDNDVAYLFGGIRQQNLDQNYRGLMAGIGKHWALAERIKVITEVGALHDFGDGYNDYNVKLGVAYTFGGSPTSARPKDSDNDGVVDSRDQCPMTPAGTVVDANGCNNDLDGDGVVNAQDKCPNTPPNTKVDATGCRLGDDADNDGVPDDMDKCPDSKPNDKVDASGCVIFEEKELTVSLNVLFANDSAVVDNPNDAQLAEFAEFLKRFVNTSAVIEGHTSAVGPREYNQGLSERRAKAVREVLIQQYGIDASRLSAVGYGETRLLDEANNAAAHRLNRRIEATVSATVKEPQQK